MSAAKLVPIPQAAAAQAVAEPLAGATQAIVKAATTPILSRKTSKVIEGKDGDDVLVENQVNITPAAIGIGAIAAWLMGLRIAPVEVDGKDGKKHVRPKVIARPPFGAGDIPGPTGKGVWWSPITWL